MINEDRAWWLGMALLETQAFSQPLLLVPVFWWLSQLAWAAMHDTCWQDPIIEYRVPWLPSPVCCGGNPKVSHAPSVQLTVI